MPITDTGRQLFTSKFKYVPTGRTPSEVYGPLQPYTGWRGMAHFGEHIGTGIL